jgi:hypothetical protein
MSFWLWLLLGLGIGTAPSLVAQPQFRSWWARRWWQLAVALAVTFLLLPFGIVLILFLIDSAWEAMGEMWALWTGDFRGLAGFALGWLAGSSTMAWRYRKAPRLQGPPLSEEVKDLARDPDRLVDAVRQYQQETGVGLAAAMDALEQFGTTPEGAPVRRPAGALEWMYLGFAAPWYGVLAIAYGLTFSGQGNPILAALGFFVFLPALFGGFCGNCGSALSAQTKAALQAGWQGRVLTRGYTFFAGTVAGALSIAGVLASVWALYPLRHSEVSLWIGFFWVGAFLIAGPFLGLWLLRRRLPGSEPAPSRSEAN